MTRNPPPPPPNLLCTNTKYLENDEEFPYLYTISVFTQLISFPSYQAFCILCYDQESQT
jgi:hypothetical protein